jgi:hypothetical protein
MSVILTTQRQRSGGLWFKPKQIIREALSRKTYHKERAGGVAKGGGTEFKLQHHTQNNWQWTQIYIFPKKTQIDNRQMKRCSESCVLRKMEMSIEMRCHLTATGMTAIKKNL